jgi:hypothetical protein
MLVIDPPAKRVFPFPSWLAAGQASSAAVRFGFAEAFPACVGYYQRNNLTSSKIAKKQQKKSSLTIYN